MMNMDDEDQTFFNFIAEQVRQHLIEHGVLSD